MALATITFKVKKPRVYQEYLQILEDVEAGKKKAEPFHGLYFDWLQKYKLQILSNQRINSTNRFSTLLAFDDLNLFVEAMMYYREFLNDPEVLGDPDPKFHIIDPDYKKYEKVVPELLHMLETAIVKLADIQAETSRIRETLKETMKDDKDGMERLLPFIERRGKEIPSLLSYLQTSLHMLKDPPDDQRILN